MEALAAHRMEGDESGDLAVVVGRIRDEDADVCSSDGNVWEPDSDEAASTADEDPPPSDDDEDFRESSIISIDGDLRAAVTRLMTEDPCEDGCLKGKAAQLEQFLCSLLQMASREKKQSIMTTLVVLRETDTVLRHRGHGLRQQFTYYLPLVGRVCRSAWCSAYGVSTPTDTRYRTRINDGIFSVKAHGNKLNQHANVFDLRWLLSWFTEFAAEVGEVAPVRVRIQKTVDGVVMKQYSPVDYTLLPAFFTWDQLYTEMHNYVEGSRLCVREPRPSTFRQLLRKPCPKIQIRSLRGNVCDLCSIYHTRMRTEVTAETTEELGRHTEAARRMRAEYKKGLESKSAVHAVIIIYYSQSLTLPSVGSTPSQWYFLSLRSVNMFGIYFANQSMQCNYMYDETVAGKGTDEVNSMLHHFIKRLIMPKGYSKLTIYADNCGGQNKNNYVIKMLLALTHMFDLESVDLKFFVKGHTKNAVDRGFGHVRKHVARADIWTMDQLLEAVNDSSASSALIHVPNQNDVFKIYRHVVKDAYKDLKYVQKYQIFSLQDKLPGVVTCRNGLDSSLVVQDLRRTYDGIVTDDTRVRVLFQTDLERLPNPPPNSEKIEQLYNKVRSSVPEEYVNDPMYDHTMRTSGRQRRWKSLSGAPQDGQQEKGRGSGGSIKGTEWRQAGRNS